MAGQGGYVLRLLPDGLDLGAVVVTVSSDGTILTRDEFEGHLTHARTWARGNLRDHDEALRSLAAEAKRWLQHDEDCPERSRDQWDCDCRLNAFLARLRAAVGEGT